MQFRFENIGYIRRCMVPWQPPTHAYVSGNYAWNNLVSIFLSKTNCWFIYTIQHLTAPIFNPLANLHNTTIFTNRHITFSF